MDWQNVLKRKIETLADYTNASPDERRKYHGARMSMYDSRLQALRHSIANVGETNPNIPLEEDMKKLQEMRNFHGKQRRRIIRGLTIPDVFSPELEQHRRAYKLVTTPRGLPNPYTDLSIEDYEKLTRNQKRNYHQGRAKHTSGEESAYHLRMSSRIYNNIDLPTSPVPSMVGESTRIRGVDNTKEEYDNMSREDKRKYHGKMWDRFRRSNNPELSKFHNKMFARIRGNSPLPTFYSPEHQEEE